MRKRHGIPWDKTQSAGENARLHLPTLLRAFFALGQSVSTAAAAPAELHAFRLAAKRFRYTLELFRPLYGPGLEKRLEQVRQIQTLLGDRQDCAVLGERLRRVGNPSDAVITALQDFERRGAELEDRFRRYWSETFAAQEAEQRWIRYFVRRPPKAPQQGPSEPAGTSSLHRCPHGGV
jgi:CHAD domain-containing protein